nr:tyrosine-type recombinase/integrase [uncultured Albidiferax sp.]
MRLIFTTGEYVYAGRPRPGFPMILGDDMVPAQPFHGYLHHHLLGRGKALDIKTWEAYGRRLWDFARFLHANDLQWDQPFESYGTSVVRVYRDWQAADLRLDPSTINDRLKQVTDFYKWAHGQQLIDELPFGQSTVTIRGIEHDLMHVTGGQKITRRADVLLDEWDKEPVFLTSSQIKMARSDIRSTSQRLLFDLMVRVGLRSIEARTFPLAYVFDPVTRPHLMPGTMIDVRLDPRDMEIKFKKPRVVHVPYSLMQDMYQYTLFERNRCVKEGGEGQALILTAHGNVHSKGSARKVMHDIGRRVNFAIRPLMLRHSYAIHTLLLLRNYADFKGEPLLYVRDRLGHASVQTTVIYLAQINRLAGGEALAMMAEFDQLFDVGFGLHTVAR